MNDSNMMVIVISAVLAVFIFWAIREVICWYFKINDRKKLLEKQVELLQEIRDHFISDEEIQENKEEEEKEE